MKANLTQWLAQARGGFKSLKEWFEKNPEPFRLEIDNKYVFYFSKKDENTATMSVVYDHRRAYEWSHGLDLTLGDINLSLDGIERLVDTAELKASDKKKAGLIPSYPMEVYNILCQFRQ